MEQKTSSYPLIIIMAAAAIIGLVATIALIITNPSRIPTATPTPHSSIAPTEFVVIESPVTTAEGEDKMVEKAKSELATHPGVTPSAISLKKAEKVTWPDSSLGCPQPGFFYSQVLTPGYKIILETQGQTYEYHADTSEEILLCKNPVNE